jgi:hypothetical protein
MNAATLGTKQNYDPVEMVRSRLNPVDVSLPRTSAILAADLAKSMKMPSSGSGSGDGTDVKTISAKMLSAGEAPQDVVKAVSQFEQARERTQTGKKPKPALWRQGLDLIPAAGLKVADVATKGIDIISRPGYATTSAAAGLLEGHTPSDAISKDLWAGLSGKNKKGGAGVLEAGGWAPTDSVANKIARGVAALGVDVGLDPTTYVSFGATSAGENIGKELGEVGVKGVAKKAVKQKYNQLAREISTGALRGEKKLAVAELDELAHAGIEAHRAKELRLYEQAMNTPNFPAAQSEMKMAYDQARAAGKSHDLSHAAAMQNLNKTTNEVHDAIRTATESFGRGRLQFRAGFMGHGPDILEGTKLGERLYRPFEWTAEQLGKTGVGDFIGNAFNYEKHFPGQLAYMRNKATSLGIQNHDALRRQVNSLFRGTDVQVRKDISHAIESDTVMANPVHENLRQEAIKIFRDMADDGKAMGTLRDKDVLQNGYVPHYYSRYAQRQKANAAGIGAESFRKERQRLIQEHGTNAGHTLQDAIAKGLRPEEDIAKIILAKGAKQNRDLVRNTFLTDLMLNHGQVNAGKLAFSDKYNIAPVEDKLIPKNVKQALGMDKDKTLRLYMPKDYHKTMQSVEKLMKFGSPEAEAKAFTRYLDNVNKVFKYSKTIARPSYHMNNMSSDMMFGFFDQTPIQDYALNLNRWMKNKAGGSAAPFRINEHHSIGFDQMKHYYQTHAGGSNFFSTEMPLNVTGMGKGARANQFAHTASQKREDFARFTHFAAATRQELRKTIGKKQLTQQEFDRALGDALSSAAHRVNKFNIDYNALTPFEQNVMRRVIPFYTYMRKATPTLIESMYLTPGRVLALDKTRRLTENMLGINHNQEFDNLRVPDWLRQGAGSIQLSNDQNPLMLSMAAMPQNLLADRFGGGNTQDLVKDQLAMGNLGLRFLPEVASGRSFFGNKKIDNPIDYLASEFNPIANFMPGTRTMNIKKLGGLPISSLSKEQQLAAIKKKTDPLQAGVSELNALLETRGYNMSKVTTKKKGTVWRISDGLSGKIVGEYMSPALAQEAANKLTGQ